MEIFDRFTSKSSVPKGFAKVNVEFTDEEVEAINASMSEYAAIANADAPDGTKMYMHPKAKDALTARCLTEYVEGLMVQLQDCPADEVAALFDKAIKAQMKAYAIHNLPVYLYQIAGMFEFLGNGAKATEFFRLFLRTQDEFRPDQIDTVFLAQTGFDMPKVIELAKQKLQPAMGSPAGQRLKSPVTDMKRQSVAKNMNAALNNALADHIGQSVRELEIEADHQAIFECLCQALVLSVMEVLVHEKYCEDDARDIMLRAFEVFFGEDPDYSLNGAFLDAFNHAHDRFVGIWILSAPLLGLTEDVLREEWARTFASELALVHRVPCSQHKIESWAFATINAATDGCKQYL